MSLRHKPDPLVSKRITEARNRGKLSQRELAEILDVSQTLVNAWEKAKSTPSATHVRLLCAALDVSADWLVGNDVREEAQSAWPEGWKVLHRAGGQLSPKKRQAVINIMEAALALNNDEEDDNDQSKE